MPDDIRRLLLAVMSAILSHDAVLGAEQVLEEVLVAFADARARLERQMNMLRVPLAGIVRIVA